MRCGDTSGHEYTLLSSETRKKCSRMMGEDNVVTLFMPAFQKLNDDQAFMSDTL